MRAFEVHAVDYLLEPVSGERLHAALERVRARLAANESPIAAGPLARAAKPSGGFLERELDPGRFLRVHRS